MGKSGNTLAAAALALSSQVSSADEPEKSQTPQELPATTSTQVEKARTQTQEKSSLLDLLSTCDIDKDGVIATKQMWKEGKVSKQTVKKERMCAWDYWIAQEEQQLAQKKQQLAQKKQQLAQKKQQLAQKMKQLKNHIILLAMLSPIDIKKKIEEVKQELKSPNLHEGEREALEYELQTLQEQLKNSD